MSKIKSLTIVNLQGSNSYHVGCVYNGGLLLDRIVDNSLEFEDSYTPMFTGFTKDGENVFEAINCPTEILYGKEE